MFRYLYYTTRYRTYLRSEHGIKEFSELCLGQLIRKVTKKSAVYREMDENLLVEKSNLRLLADELAQKSVLDSGEFFSIRRRLRGGSVIISAVMLAGVLVTYASVSALIQSNPGVGETARWVASFVLAAVLVGGGLVAMERLLESVLWRRRIQAEPGTHVDRWEATLWLMILGGLELTIWGAADLRAELLGGYAQSERLEAAFLAFAMLLPVVGGALRWDALRFIDVYKRTQAQRQIETRLAQIDSILRQNEEFESNFYKVQSLVSWQELNAFKSFKNVYDAKRGTPEDLTGHFAQSYDAFQREASRRYEADIRDMTSKSLRKLSLLEKKPSGDFLESTAAGDGQNPMPLLPALSDGTSSASWPES